MPSGFGTDKCISCGQIGEILYMYPYGDPGCEVCWPGIWALEKGKRVKGKVDVEKLAEDHWAYNKKLLIAAMGGEDSCLGLVGVAYVEAFKHGFKHGLDSVK